MPGPRPSRRVWSGDTYFLWLPFAALVEQPIRGIWSGEKGEEGTLKTTRAAGCNDLKCASEDMTNIICSIFIFSFVFFWGEGWGLHEPEWGYASSPCARGLEALNLSHHFQRGFGWWNPGDGQSGRGRKIRNQPWEETWYTIHRWLIYTLVHRLRNQLENHSNLLKIISVKGVLWHDEAEANVLLCSLLINTSKAEGSRTGTCMGSRSLFRKS